MNLGCVIGQQPCHKPAPVFGKPALFARAGARDFATAGSHDHGNRRGVDIGNCGNGKSRPGALAMGSRNTAVHADGVAGAHEPQAPLDSSPSVVQLDVCRRSECHRCLQQHDAIDGFSCVS